MADIFPTDERSPESYKTRREHLGDMSTKELSRWILSVESSCNVCENRRTCVRRYPNTSISCVQGIEEWLDKQTGIFD